MKQVRTGFVAVVLSLVLFIPSPVMAAVVRIVSVQPYLYNITITEDDPDGANARVAGGIFGGMAGGALLGFMCGGPVGAVAGSVLGVNGGGAVGSMCASGAKRKRVSRVSGYKVVFESGSAILTRAYHRAGEYVDLDSVECDYLLN